MAISNRHPRKGLHAFDVKESNNAALGKGGVFCINDTKLHYGDYFAIYCVTDTIFAVLTEANPNANGLAFTTGVSHTIVPGDVIVGETTGAKAIVESVTITSGSVAVGDAAGYMVISIINSINFDALEKIDYYSADGVLIDNEVCVAAADTAGGETDPEALAGRTFYSGTTIFGNFSAIDLTSGSVLAYKS